MSFLLPMISADMLFGAGLTNAVVKTVSLFHYRCQKPNQIGGYLNATME